MPPPKTGAPGVPEVGTEGALCHLHEVSLTHQQPHHGGRERALLTCPRHTERDSGRARMQTQLIHLPDQECTPGPAALPLCDPLQGVDALGFQQGAEGARDLSPVAREG